MTLLETRCHKQLDIVAMDALSRFAMHGWFHLCMPGLHLIPDLSSIIYSNRRRYPYLHDIAKI